LTTAKPWYKQLGHQCLLALGLGVVAGLAVPGLAPWLNPLAQIFLRASQVVVMPFLIVELVGSLGGLSDQALRSLFRSGGVVLLLLWGLAAAMVLGLPQALPSLLGSNFFYPELLEPQPSLKLIDTYLPFNIFSALAADNFPAVVLYSTVLGILLQRLPERQQLLDLCKPLRQLLGQMNRLVAKIVPLGIFALSVTTISQLQPDQLLRIQGFFLICLLAFLLLNLLLIVLLLALTPFTLGQLWGALRGPLALTASSTNLLIALPMLGSNLQALLDQNQGLPPQTSAAGEAAIKGASEGVGEEVTALLSVGFALPMLGQVASLLFLPFAAWYVNQPLDLGATARMLATGIPTLAGGLKAAFRQELLQAGLPQDLMQLVYLNAEWLDRFEKVLSLEGLILLTLLVVCQTQGKLRWQPLRLGAGAAGSLLLGGLLGWGLNRSLAKGLQGQYRNAQVLLNLQPMLAGAAPSVVFAPGPAAPVSLAAIRQRGVLRVGLRGDGLPWAYGNRQGRLVGLDVDLVQALASNLGLRLELVQAKLPTLEKLLDEQRIDLAMGGIQASPERAARHQASQGYLKVHLGLVVPDGKLKQLQRLPIQGLAKPLVLAVTDPQLVTTNLRQGISEHLGSAARPLALELVLIDSKEQFFAGAASGRYDGWLTPAEGGAAWAVLHPDFSLITPFGKGLSGQLVILAGGNDPNLLDYLNAWLAREQARGLLERLFDHWIRVLPTASSHRHG